MTPISTSEIEEASADLMAQVIRSIERQMAAAYENGWTWVFTQATWEERLAAEIERRSLRNRLRRGRAALREKRSEYADRIGVAWDVLRGRHGRYCDDYDFDR